MTNPEPKVSILLPVHNSEEFLSLTMDSLLAQSFEDFEVLALDDGSTDRSYEILTGYAARDSRVRIIRHQNMGITRTCNKGLAVARAALIARIDADDIAWPTRLARQTQFFADHPDVVAAGTSFRAIDPEGRVIRTRYVPLDHEDIEAKHLEMGEPQLCHPSSMIRKAALDAVGGYDESFPVAQDFDLWLRLAEIGRLGNLASVELDRRLHQGSIGYTRREEQTDAVKRALEGAARRRNIEITIPEKSPSKASRPADIMRRWAWWALTDGNLLTARYYARQAVWMAPFSLSTWRLVAAVIRGH